MPQDGLLDFKIIDGVKRVATNGKSAYIDQNYAVEITASQGVKGVSTAVLHATLHCLFTHPFVKVENEEKYDLSCDMVVGFVLDGLGYPFGDKLFQNKRKAVYKAIIDQFGGVNDQSASKFCQNLSQSDIEEYGKIFTLCNSSGNVLLSAV